MKPRTARGRSSTSPAAGKVPLSRALSKLGLLSRAEAIRAIIAGRVRIDGRIVRNPGATVVPERIRVTIDGERRERAGWRTILLNKPRGVVTTRRDPQGRRTVFDVLGENAKGLVAVGRLDLATTGLLLLTTDTRLANWITDPRGGVVRSYVVIVRGRIDTATVERLTAGVDDRGERLAAERVVARKVSGRESHLLVDLREGRNREIRRLFAAAGHEVTSLKRIRLGGLELGTLEPGAWRDVSREEISRAFNREIS